MPNPAANASVKLVLTLTKSGDSQTFRGQTDELGQITYTGKLTPDGNYKEEVTGLTHRTLIWNSVMDAKNPDFYYGVPNGSDWALRRAWSIRRGCNFIIETPPRVDG